ncbi:MAG: hypothetical protein HOY71_45180 [Nonomuraea sp.]|nr:hypothetical protein [Nonomuraea sp.]
MAAPDLSGIVVPMPFPGRFIGGITLILGPLVWLAGFALRYYATETVLPLPQREWAARQEFAAPGQLAAYVADPALLTASFALFAAGAALLFPAFVALAQLVRTQLAYWGATLVVVGLFARFYFAGADQTAFRLTEPLGLGTTTNAVMSQYVDIAYGPWLVPVMCSVGQYAGTLVLAVAAWRSGYFGIWRSLLLLASGTTWVGVLKASTLPDVAVTVLMCVVLVPVGVRLLRVGAGYSHPTPA